MNYNQMPVKIRALKDMVQILPDGEERAIQAGEVFECTWMRCKRLEREGSAERVAEIRKSNGAAVRDVLIFTPMYRLEPETVKALMEQEWEGALSFLIQRDNPKEGTQLDDKKANHLHQYQRGRDFFLRGSYEAMLVVESDIIPPADALKRLAALNVDCAYGVYQFRKSDLINVFEYYPVELPMHVGNPLSVKPWLLERAKREGTFPCSGAGLGIVLIRREVLEKIEFHWDDQAFCDTPFTEEVLRARFSQAADMGVVCGHKDTDGVIYWPEMDEKE